MTFLLLTVWFLLTEHELFLQGSFIHRYLGLYIKFLHFSLSITEFKPIIEFKIN